MKRLALLKYRTYITILSSLADITNYLAKKHYFSVLQWLKRVLELFHIYYFPICNSSKAQHLGKAHSITIDKAREGVYSNLVFGDVPANNVLVSKDLRDLHVIEYNNVVITGLSQYVLDIDNGFLINDFSTIYDEKLYENVDALLMLQKGESAFLKKKIDDYQREIQTGIMLSGRFAFNFYHTFFENYSKLIALEKACVPDSVPLIVDSIYTKYESYREILRALNIKGREIVLIDQLETLKVEKLYTLEDLNLLPPQAKDIKKIRAEDVVYDINYLVSLRAMLLPLRSERHYSKRVFLSRKGNARRSWNEDELFAYLRDKGFEQYAPQDLSFAEQISLFNNAEFIVGGSGAALSNLLFCSAGCKVICLYSERVNAPVFTTLAYMNGATMKYVIGHPIKGSSVNNTHSDFRVNLEEFKTVFTNYEKE